jgi:hypothetical protein
MNSAKFVKNTSEIEKRLSSVKYDLYLHAMLFLCGIMLLLLVLNNNSNAYLLIAIISFAILLNAYFAIIAYNRKFRKLFNLLQDIKIFKSRLTNNDCVIVVHNKLMRTKGTYSSARKPMFVEKELMLDNSDFFERLSIDYNANTRACGYTTVLAAILLNFDAVIVVNSEMRQQELVQTAIKLIYDKHGL